MRYDRARTSLDRHATYIVATYLVATYIAGAARQLPQGSLAAVGGQTDRDHQLRRRSLPDATPAPIENRRYGRSSGVTVACDWPHRSYRSGPADSQLSTPLMPEMSAFVCAVRKVE